MSVEKDQIMSIFDVSSMDSLEGSVNANSDRTVPWCHNWTIIGLGPESLVWPTDS